MPIVAILTSEAAYAKKALKINNETNNFGSMHSIFTRQLGKHYVKGQIILR